MVSGHVIVKCKHKYLSEFMTHQDVNEFLSERFANIYFVGYPLID